MADRRLGQPSGVRRAQTGKDHRAGDPLPADRLQKGHLLGPDHLFAMQPEHDDRNISDTAGQRLEQHERAGIRPVQVIQYDQQPARHGRIPHDRDHVFEQPEPAGRLPFQGQVAEGRRRLAEGRKDGQPRRVRRPAIPFATGTPYNPQPSLPRLPRDRVGQGRLTDTGLTQRKNHHATMASPRDGQPLIERGQLPLPPDKQPRLHPVSVCGPE